MKALSKIVVALSLIITASKFLTSPLEAAQCWEPGCCGYTVVVNQYSCQPSTTQCRYTADQGWYLCDTTQTPYGDLTGEDGCLQNCPPGVNGEPGTCEYDQCPNGFANQCVLSQSAANCTETATDCTATVYEEQCTWQQDTNDCTITNSRDPHIRQCWVNGDGGQDIGDGVCGTACGGNEQCASGYTCTDGWCDNGSCGGGGSGVCGNTCTDDNDCSSGYSCSGGWCNNGNCGGGSGGGTCGTACPGGSADCDTDNGYWCDGSSQTCVNSSCPPSTNGTGVCGDACPGGTADCADGYWCDGATQQCTDGSTCSPPPPSGQGRCGYNCNSGGTAVCDTANGYWCDGQECTNGNCTISDPCFGAGNCCGQACPGGTADCADGYWCDGATQQCTSNTCGTSGSWYACSANDDPIGPFNSCSEAPPGHYNCQQNASPDCPEYQPDQCKGCDSSDNVVTADSCTGLNNCECTAGYNPSCACGGGTVWKKDPYCRAFNTMDDCQADSSSAACTCSCQNDPEPINYFVVFEDLNENGVWDYDLGEQILSNDSSCTANSKLLEGYSIVEDGIEWGTGYSHCSKPNDPTCSADLLCDSPPGSGNWVNEGKTCHKGWDNEEGQIKASCLDSDVSRNCDPQSDDVYEGVLCRLNPDYCNSSSLGYLRDKYGFERGRKLNECAEYTINLPDGWRISDGSQEIRNICYDDLLGNVRGECKDTLHAFGVVQERECTVIPGGDVTSIAEGSSIQYRVTAEVGTAEDREVMLWLEKQDFSPFSDAELPANASRHGPYDNRNYVKLDNLTFNVNRNTPSADSYNTVSVGSTLAEGDYYLHCQIGVPEATGNPPVFTEYACSGNPACDYEGIGGTSVEDCKAGGYNTCHAGSPPYTDFVPLSVYCSPQCTSMCGQGDGCGGICGNGCVGQIPPGPPTNLSTSNDASQQDQAVFPQINLTDTGDQVGLGWTSPDTLGGTCSWLYDIVIYDATNEDYATLQDALDAAGSSGDVLLDRAYSTSYTFTATPALGNKLSVALRTLNSCDINLTSDWGSPETVYLVAEIEGTFRDASSDPEAVNDVGGQCTTAESFGSTSVSYNSAGYVASDWYDGDLNDRNDDLHTSTIGSSDTTYKVLAGYAPDAGWSGQESNLSLQITNNPSGTQYSCACGGDTVDKCIQYSLSAPQTEVDFYVAEMPHGAWWMSFGGLSYSQADTVSPLPNEASNPYSEYLFNNALNDLLEPLSGGIPQAGGSIVVDPTGLYSGKFTTFNNAAGSNNVFVTGADHSQLPDRDYDYYVSRVTLTDLATQLPDTIDQKSDITSTFISALDDGTNVAWYDGDLTIEPASSTIAIDEDESIIIFVNGDVTFEDDNDVESLLSVAPGGYLAIIANGTIAFETSVGYQMQLPPSASNPDVTSDTNVEGVFIADTIETKTLGMGTANSKDKHFIGQGSFVGWNNIILGRSYDDNNIGRLQSETDPTETFSFRPDFIANTPAILRETTIIWQEAN